jgi:hypothetical protein
MRTDEQLIQMFREAEFYVDIASGGTGPCVLGDGTAIDGEERVERAIRRELGLPRDGQMFGGLLPGGFTGATMALLHTPLDPPHRARVQQICEEGRRLGPLPEQLIAPKPTKTMYFVRALGPASPPDGGVGRGFYEDLALAEQRAAEERRKPYYAEVRIEPRTVPGSWPQVVTQ